jgi:PAB1-binding protein PBP1
VGLCLCPTDAQQTSTNSHIAEERGFAAESAKDEEEKYSGVQRAPNAYVPPGARRTTGPSTGVPAKPPTGPAANKANGVPPKPAASAAVTINEPPQEATPAAPTTNRSTSEVVVPADKAVESAKTSTPSPRPDNGADSAGKVRLAWMTRVPLRR